MKKLLYLINHMTAAMDRNVLSEISAHLRLLVYFASQIVSENSSEEDKALYIEKFNKEIEYANKRGIWTPYTAWD